MPAKRAKPDTDPNKLVSMVTAADMIGPRRGQSPTNDRTVRGWCIHGLNGVRLRSLWQGGIRMTCWQWIQDFFEAVGERKELAREREQFPMPTPAELKQRYAAAKAELEAMGEKLPAVPKRFGSATA